MREHSHVIDLHMHTVHSDGTYTTQEVIRMLQEKHVDIFSFTDHDSVGCYFDLMNGNAELYPEATLIPGVELSCRVDGNLRDMLGYGVDVSYIADYLAKRYSKENRIAKEQKVLEEFKDICRREHLIFDESIQAVEGKKAEGYTVMYMELNRHPENLETHPFVSDCTRLYWDFFANKNSSFFVDETFDLPDFAEAVEVIHKAGGKAFLAHPFVYSPSAEQTDHLIRHAMDAGIEGMELKHQSNKPGQVEHLLDVASRYNLLLSGGSDFHGKNKPDIALVTAFGNMLVDYGEIEPWVNQVRHWN